MKLTDKPSQIGVPFASSGDKNTLPVNATQETKEKGKAAWDSGFPPLTMTAIAAGGVPPSGKDFNGVLNAISAGLRFAMAGGLYPYSADFSASIGGYPLGAILISADGSKVWWNASDANTTDPDSTSASGWKNLLQDPDGLFLRKAQNLADLQNKGTARQNLELDKVGNFMAVQQGGGTGMLTNKVYLGWSGTKLIAQVDSTQMGELFYINNPPPYPVTSVNSKTGAVSLSKSDIGLGNVGNYAAVQQGGGIGQAANKIYLGWGTDGRLRFTVDSSDQGTIYSTNNPPPFPVTSVNGVTGAVTTATANLAGGWHKDSATGLITQWGFTQNSSINEEAHGFNIAFPNACVGVLATLGTTIGNGSTVYASPVNTQGFNAKTSGSLIGFRWLAWGY